MTEASDEADARYFYVISVENDPEGYRHARMFLRCTPVSFKFGRTSDPFRRLQQHRKGAPGAFMQLHFVGQGTPTQVLEVETRVRQEARRAGLLLGESCEWTRAHGLELVRIVHENHGYQGLNLEVVSPDWVDWEGALGFHGEPSEGVLYALNNMLGPERGGSRA